MTLDELGKWLTDLGCKEAMNLDGGGSATLWYNGEVRNNPADRVEREIANCLVVVKKNK
jgi:exopolysaccharide biosynthesis protein